MADLFVSDVHLDAGTPAASAQFLEFLTSIAARAERLYILGDLFEAWIGDDDPDVHKARICEGLKALSDSGVACFALHGNRDFLLAEGFTARTGVIVLPDPVIAQFAGEATLLTHGDILCVDDHAYQELRSIVRAPVWQQRFLGLPLIDRVSLGEQLRAGSRAHIARSVPYVMDTNPKAVEAAFRATGVRRMIHGHTHRPAVHESVIDAVPHTRIVLGAWYEQGSYLHHEAGRFELRELARQAHASHSAALQAS